jgi:hypothetical protein
LLALASRRTLHRGQLIDHLWPEHEPHRAANNLDQAVHAARLLKFFRARLGAEVVELSPLVYSWLAGRGGAARNLVHRMEAAGPVRRPQHVGVRR